MASDITASWETLMDQAGYTAKRYLADAVEILGNSDMKYTTGDAIALAAIMASDFHAASVGVAAQNIRRGLESITYKLDELT